MNLARGDMIEYEPFRRRTRVVEIIRAESTAFYVLQDIYTREIEVLKQDELAARNVHMQPSTVTLKSQAAKRVAERRRAEQQSARSFPVYAAE